MVTGTLTETTARFLPVPVCNHSSTCFTTRAGA